MANTNLNQTYEIRQNYLNSLDDYESEFTDINKDTSFAAIEKHIDKELAKTTQDNLPPDINSLHKQLDYIVYLSNLSYFYIENSGTRYQKLREDSESSSKRGLTLWALLKQKQILFNNNLQTFIKKLSQKDKIAEKLITHEIEYLTATSTATLSFSLTYIAKTVLKINTSEIKSQSKKDCTQLEKLFKNYKYRCIEGEEMINMSKTKNNADDDSSSLDSFSTAPEEPIIDAAPPNQATAEEHNKPTIHVEEKEKEQNPSHKNNLLTKIWALIKKIWQHIKNIFKNPEKNHELDTVVSYSASEQRITDLRYSNVREIPAAKKGCLTLFSTTANSQQNQSPEQSTEKVVGFINRR